MGRGVDRADHLSALIVAAISTALTGWDVLFAVLVVLVVLVLDRPARPSAATVLTVFGVALLVSALLVAW